MAASTGYLLLAIIFYSALGGFSYHCNVCGFKAVLARDCRWFDSIYLLTKVLKFAMDTSTFLFIDDRYHLGHLVQANLRVLKSMLPIKFL